MSSYTHICPPCNKTFNSKEQWNAHKEGKKHKYIYEIVLKEKNEGKKQIPFNNSNNIDDDIQKL